MEAGATGKGQLLFALAILIGFGGVLAVAAGGGSSQAAPGTETLAELSVRLEPRVAERVEALRGLEFESVPEPEVVDSEYLNRLGAREARRLDARHGVAADEAALRILGLIEPDEELESIFGATGDLAAAAYDPRKDRLYVVSDSVTVNQALVEFVLAHELTHALEDQQFGLGGGAKLDDDASLAGTALTEGTATAMMIAYASEYIGATDLLGATAALGADDAGVPAFYVDQITWTYLGGARFVAALRQLGGGWKLVDYALSDRPPASTEQVLHVDKYVRDEPPLPVNVESAGLAAGGWRKADSGVVGELSTAQLLELGVSAARARQAAAGWGGDRYELWRQDAAPAGCDQPCRADSVLVVDWRMDSVGNAVELYGTLSRYLGNGLDGIAGSLEAWDLDGGAAALRQRGDDVALVFAPESETAVAIAGEQVGP